MVNKVTLEDGYKVIWIIAKINNKINKIIPIKINNNKTYKTNHMINQMM